MVCTSDYLLDRCSSVPAGDAVVLTKGKKGEGDEAYPTKVSELERELEEEAPEIESDVRAIAERATKDMRERAICYILRGGLITRQRRTANREWSLFA